MKPSFHTRLVNSPFEDPCLYIRLLREGRALLFDAGFTTNLSAGDILKISDIFISHTHIDHFIGFDSILRLHLRREYPLRLYGPKGFIDCVEGKLRGYTWNLIGNYPLVIEVLEIHEKSLKKAIFRAKDAFMRKDLEEVLFDGWQSFCIPGNNPARHVVDFPEIELRHYIQGVSAAISASAVNEISFVLIQIVKLIPESFGIIIYINCLLYMPLSKFFRCSHINSYKIWIILVVLHQGKGFLCSNIFDYLGRNLGFFASATNRQYNPSNQ